MKVLFLGGDWAGVVGEKKKSRGGRGTYVFLLFFLLGHGYLLIPMAVASPTVATTVEGEQAG